MPNGLKEIHDPLANRTITTDVRGRVQRIEAPQDVAGLNKIVISHGPGGGRVVETGHPGNRVVSYGPRSGFVERPLKPGYVSRTFVRGGVSYAHVYRQAFYRKIQYYRYVPGFYYGPRFYTWAVTPWGAPMPYVWFGTMAPSPWFGFYAGYFTPYPIYASPMLWLTDYMLAENLRLAYESQQAGNDGQAPNPPANSPDAASLSPQVKELIAAEVRQQIDAERAATAPQTAPAARQTSEQLPPALTQKFFVVSSNLDITLGNGQACSLTPGDVIQRRSGLQNDGSVAVEVETTKPGDCAVDSAAQVQLADLQEMHNQFREQLDSGLEKLAGNKAQGLPQVQAPGGRAVTEGTVAPAPGAEAQLAAQESDAAKLEAQVRQAGGAK